MKDLGTKAESIPAPCEKSDKPSYPTLSLRDKALEAFLGGEKVSVGDEFEVTFKLRCCGASDQKYGKSMEFEVLESDPLGMEDGEEDEKDGAKYGKEA